MRRPRSESKAEARGGSLLPPPGSIPASEGLEEARPQRAWRRPTALPIQMLSVSGNIQTHLEIMPKLGTCSRSGWPPKVNHHSWGAAGDKV